MREQRRATGDGREIPFLESMIIPAGFRHGFTTRHGGVSAPPFDTFNLGWKWGDDRAAVDENHRRFLAASGAKVLHRASQVHGVRVLLVRAEDDPEAVAREQADGLMTRDPGVGITVHVADCTPILLACPVTDARAALHAGWRGTVAGMAKAGVAAMVAEFGCAPSDIHAVLGPCIGACCFEVGPDVVDEFVKAMPDAREQRVILETPGRKPRVDLRRFSMLGLLSAGLLPSHVESATECTLCDPGNRFFSYRKSGRATGQSAGFIVR